MAKMEHSVNQRSGPVWLKDWANREHLALFPAKLVAGAFTDAAAVVVTVGAAGAAQGATTLPVDALAVPGFPNVITPAVGGTLIPAGTVLYFGGEKIATLTADAAIGATSLTVAALPNALVDNDVARYSRYGRIYVPSGTLVGRTYTERGNSVGFGPADLDAGPDDEIFIVAFDVEDVNTNNDVELVRNGERIAENYLPNYSTLDATALALLRGRYQTFIGVD